MKFGKRLSVEAVPEWREFYMPYKKLKRVINRAKVQADARKERRQESELRSSPDARAEFFQLLEDSLIEVNRFFMEQLDELRTKLSCLNASRNQSVSTSDSIEPPSIVSYGDEHARQQGSYSENNRNRVTPMLSNPVGISNIIQGHEQLGNADFRDQILDFYGVAKHLENFRELNREGFRKIVKKFDKIMQEKNEGKWTERVNSQQFVLTDNLELLIRDIQAAFASAAADDGDIESAWKIYSKTAHSSHLVFTIKWGYIVLAFIAMTVVLACPILENHPSAHRCLGLLTAVTISWVTEAVPYFVTGLAIPFMTVLLRILVDSNGDVLSAKAATQSVMSSMFSTTTMLVLGGFSLAAAFSKFQFELRLAEFIQKRIGHHPRLFLLAFMYMALFLSMWISNVAGAVLCSSVLMPILHDLPRDSRFVRAAMLSLAFACNLGGMMSVIASPQNSVANGDLDTLTNEDSISFFRWITVALPFCVVCLPAVWGYIVLVLRPNDLQRVPEIYYIKETFGRNHFLVLGVSLVTVFLLCSLSFSESVFGDMSLIAIIPLVVFFGVGILNKEDLSNFSWNLILLIGGGSVLGSAVSSSQLLSLIANEISPYLQRQSLWAALVLICLFVFVVTSFVSHTVAAIILTPIVIQVAQQVGSIQLLVMASTLMCSGSMSLPMTSFPNLNALLAVDDFDKPYLSVADFVRHGTPCSILVFGLLISWGYLLMHLQLS